MCKNCKTSELGQQRQTELDAAIAECKLAGVNPGTGGFIVRHGGNMPMLRTAQRAALERYNTAWQAMKKLHDDYVWQTAREYAEEMRAKGIKPISFSHADPQRKQQ